MAAMTEESRSPRRAHILSSINPPDKQQDERHHVEDDVDHAPTHEEPIEHKSKGDEDDRPKTSRFRFKSKESKSRHRSHHARDRDEDERRHRRRHRSRSRSRSRDDEEGKEGRRDDDDERSHRSSRHHHRRRRHRRHRSRSRSPQRSPQRHKEKEGGHGAEEAEDPYAPPPLSPNAAFREALFDAMADDEGAAYWQGVYGQPLHVYDDPGRANEATGELERMSEEEYAAYVRQKMWEKTHAGLLEERERRAKEREERSRREEEARRVTAEMERSLRRGEERRRKKASGRKWEVYVKAWEGWDGDIEKIPWPVESGLRGDVGDAEAVRKFFVLGLDLEALGEKDFASKLKDERVRWHPDKMQQRMGGREKADADLMKDVTAIFQTIDRLWADVRAGKTA